MRVGRRPVVSGGLEPVGQQRHRCAHLIEVPDRTCRCGAACLGRSVAEVQQREEEVVRVLVLVAVLECVDLENDVGQ
jgi:hypothetical protein